MTEYFIARQGASRSLEKQIQQSEFLGREFDFVSFARQFPGIQIMREISKAVLPDFLPSPAAKMDVHPGRFLRNHPAKGQAGSSATCCRQQGRQVHDNNTKGKANTLAKACVSTAIRNVKLKLDDCAGIV